MHHLLILPYITLSFCYITSLIPSSPLQKVVHKTYNKMTPSDDSGGNHDGDGSKKGKTKPPNMNRMIKSRLQKLVDKTDDL